MTQIQTIHDMPISLEGNTLTNYRCKGIENYYYIYFRGERYYLNKATATEGVSEWDAY